MRCKAGGPACHKLLEINPLLNRRAQRVDILLLLEGTFPYVPGGVSSWVNQIIRAFPQYQFGIVFIGGRREDYGKPHYELPDNVVHFEEFFLQDADVTIPVSKSATSRKVFNQVTCLHDAFRNTESTEAIGQLIREVAPMLSESGGLSEQHFRHSEGAWDFLTARYEEYCTDPSFTDYFWTVRIMHMPIWRLVRICENLIPARLYHTCSTGYAGLLGALLRYRSTTPLLVTEHGIYTKERKIDLLQSLWLQDNRGVFEKDISKPGYFQSLWVRFFETMGRVCYDAADEIVALYEGNRQRQIHDGAPAAKTRRIPNGIDVNRYTIVRDQRPEVAPHVVALIGRVVPIKDIKTFIRSIFIAVRRLPNLRGWIIGPQYEDPEYVRECIDLVASLGLQNNIEFLGFRRIDELLPEVGLVALSSISEGLPLVVLEAFAAGVPVVTTDVGSCRELVQGTGDEDRSLGEAGAVVEIANPGLFADAIIDLLEQPLKWQAARQAAIARVERYYTHTIMEDAYGNLYGSLMRDVKENIACGEASWRG
jgi:glycosyltransferase involved in cell wall biosynthesis